LLARRSVPYAFTSRAVLRSSKGGEGVLDDKEKAQENVYIRRHEEEEMKKATEEKERKAREEAKKNTDQKKK